MSYFPEFDKFAELAERSNMVTVCRQFSNEFLTPVSAFLILDKSINRDTFLLESAEVRGKMARYSYLAIDPFLRFEAKRDEATITPGLLPPDSDWILHAPYNFDRAMMRNVFIMDLSNRVGPYACRTRFPVPRTPYPWPNA